MLFAVLVNRSVARAFCQSLMLSPIRTSQALCGRLSLRQTDAIQSRTRGFDGATLSRAENDLLRKVGVDSRAAALACRSSAASSCRPPAAPPRRELEEPLPSSTR